MPAQLERFVVLELLDAHGSVSHYEAFDPQLGRCVSLRVMPAGALADRLLRGVQELARVNHPNLAGIYGVGMHDDALLVAMERARGPTLREWASERPRSPEELVRAYVQAGRGLAAAHRAGLVHGAFSSDRAVLGKHGHVRVVDFDVSDEPLARSADARSDQRDFCVALEEALAGRAPDDTPAHVRAALARGRAVDSRRRWATMDQLLAALERDPARRRRRWLAVAVSGLAVGGTLFAASVARAERERECERRGSDMRAVWDDETRTEVRGTLLGADAAHASDTWQRLESAMDDTVAEWATASEHACRVDRIERGRSSDLADRADQCFDDARESIAAALEQLSVPRPHVVERALPLLDRLPRVDSCTREDDLRDHWLLPDEPVRREQVVALSHALTRNEAKRWAREFDDGLPTAQALAEQADELGWRPLQARAWLELGHFAVGAHDGKLAHRALEHALALAMRTGAEEFAVEAAIVLLAQSDGSERDRARSERWRWLAQTLLARSSVPNVGLEIDLLRALADAESNRPDHDDEDRLVTRALELAEAHYGPSHSKVGSLSYRLGMVRRSQSRYAEAIALLERARDIQVRALGPGHSFVGQVLGVLAMTLESAGRHDEARATAEQSVAVTEGALGPDHLDLAGPLNYLASIYAFGGENELALRTSDRALMILERSEDHVARYNLAVGRLNRGAGAVVREDYAAALPDLYRALAILRELGQSDEWIAGTVYMILGAAHRALGDALLARDVLARSSAIYARRPDSDEAAFVFFYAGDVEMMAGDRDAALAFYERAMATCDRLECTDAQRTDFRFRVVFTLEQLGRERERAEALRQEATATLERLSATERQNLLDGFATWREKYARVSRASSTRAGARGGDP
jgi:eukaryotic-like serine/threonine-protein kinase